MKRKLAKIDISEFPQEFHSLLYGANVYDSSSSKEASVIFVDKGNGYYLKSAAKGTLQSEAELTSFFHDKELAAKMLCYISNEKDYMLTERVAGEDCTCKKYLESPNKLCDTLAECLRKLHSIDFSKCPVKNRTESYLATANKNYRAYNYDVSFFLENFRYKSADEAWSVMEEKGRLLKSDTLIHGDFCLPNIILNEWKFSGVIDLGNGGVSDRHIDLFWGAWSLCFNLKDKKYKERFYDAYGRENMDEEILKIVAAAEVFG